MYSKNYLDKLAEKLGEKYKDITLDNPFKTHLFHLHIKSAQRSLNKASELVGSECEDIEDDYYKSPMFVILMLTISILFFFHLVR